ncbi:3'-5' exonuclease [Agromyces rhizosphaerae]|uniref:3'-5' exonuclease n=1 Tax=Agromyces rhizosphaerae TaxID=88374 RepID=A0A9W6FT03_9MICO|nr:HRDC domain-containing protein [Agromyces rhizosphaerae]GLI28758.1 3'-5' exonuclease [Agromyces rhizosphaerae]
MADYQVIDTPDGLAAAAGSIASGAGPVAVDAERASGFRYSQRAYLIQVYRRGAGTFLFDPPPIGDFAPLQDAIGDEEWILHAASQDLACLREVGLDPVRIFDTELGARLLGRPKVGLAAVVEDLLGITLAKEHSAADWSTRPIPQSWLQYAALDVEHLVDVRERMGDELDAADKRAIAEEEFRAVLEREAKPAPAEPWRRLSGIHGVRGQRALAIARALWTARDEYARETDIAPGRLVPDAAIVAVAKSLPESKRALAELRTFTGRASRTEIDRWWAAIEEGRTTQDLPAVRVPADTLPPVRAWSSRNPEADARLKPARRALTEVAESMGMPVENLLTPDYLRRVAWSPPEPATAVSIASALADLGARPWQVDATAQRIADAFVEAAQADDVGVTTGS